MKNTVTFYILLTLKDLQFLAENSFTKLPFNEIPVAFKKEELIQYAEKVNDDTNGIFITAKVECNMDRFNDYKVSSLDESLTEFEGFSKVMTERINYSLLDKVKLDDVFGKNIEEPDHSEIKTIIEDEMYFSERRMEIFLETHSREIILPDFFKEDAEEKQEPRDFSDEEVRQQIKKTLAEEEISLKKIKEKTRTLNTVEEAVDYLVREDLSPKAISQIKNISYAARLDHLKGDFGFHFGFGMYLRNIFFHGNNNQELYKDLEKYQTHVLFNHGEFGEGIIYDALWRKLNDCKTTKENIKRISDIREQLKTETDADFFWISEIKIRMLSYNFRN
jgi:hypothetical protein